MLRIAVQSKGRLFEDTVSLLAEVDIKVSNVKRTLLMESSNFPVEILYLRDDDIPQTVASGVADLGIVGEIRGIHGCGMVRGQNHSHLLPRHPPPFHGEGGCEDERARDYWQCGDCTWHRTCRWHL